MSKHWAQGFEQVQGTKTKNKMFDVLLGTEMKPETLIKRDKHCKCSGSKSFTENSG